MAKRARPRDDSPIDKPEGKVSTKTPRKKSERVCYTRPARSERRVYSPSDLRRVYRYVVGSYGWNKATCAVLDESGLYDYIESAGGQADALDPCSTVNLSFLADVVPDWMDEEVGVPPGTLQSALTACDDAGGVDISLGVAVRVVLAVLIIIWGAWRKVSRNRLIRFVLKRLVITTIVLAVLDEVDELIVKLVPLLLEMADVITFLRTICDEEQDVDAAGSTRKSP